ncbi:MAG TPA: DinB family protein [Thermoanaerobaculia bacterium]|nr:DinB family protein [Thermoanaerobaculia bacterium]
MSRFIIGDLEGFTPQIARLVSMMAYTRQTTVDAVQGLSVDDLDWLHDNSSNSIGALLAHIAAVEVAYQVDTVGVDERALRGREAALDLGDRARKEIRGRSLIDCVEDLESVRATTLRELGKRDDRWLYEESPFWEGKPANNYFKWFHVFEDELNHRGQIRFLVKRLPRR